MMEALVPFVIISRHVDALPGLLGDWDVFFILRQVGCEGRMRSDRLTKLPVLLLRGMHGLLSAFSGTQHLDPTIRFVRVQHALVLSLHGGGWWVLIQVVFTNTILTGAKQACHGTTCYVQLRHTVVHFTISLHAWLASMSWRRGVGSPCIVS